MFRPDRAPYLRRTIFLAVPCPRVRRRQEVTPGGSRFGDQVLALSVKLRQVVLNKLLYKL
jgi:hypothetical protein